jgi:hypothetical protein
VGSLALYHDGRLCAGPCCLSMRRVCMTVWQRDPWASVRLANAEYGGAFAVRDRMVSSPALTSQTRTSSTDSY